VALGIHTHNDAELAVANSLEAVRLGAVQVQGTAARGVDRAAGVACHRVAGGGEFRVRFGQEQGPDDDGRDAGAGGETDGG